RLLLRPRRRPAGRRLRIASRHGRRRAGPGLRRWPLRRRQRDAVGSPPCPLGGQVRGARRLILLSTRPPTNDAGRPLLFPRIHSPEGLSLLASCGTPLIGGWRVDASLEQTAEWFR